MNNSISLRKTLTVESLFDNLIWLLAAALFATFYIMNQNIYGSYIQIGITALILLLMFAKGRGKIYIRFDAFHWFVLGFAAYVAMTALWAQSSSNAVQKATTIVEILLCMTVLYWHYSHKDSTEKLLKAVMWGSYVIVLYTLMQYGLDGIMEAVENEERFSVEFANINAVSMVSSVAVVINIHFWRRKIQRVSAVFALPALLVVGASGSRKALVLLLLGFVLVYLFDLRSKNAVIQVFKVLLFAVIALAVIRLILMLPVFSVAANRLDRMIQGFLGTGDADSSTKKRMMYVEYGWKIFKQYPIFGVGYNNTYLHMDALIGDGNYLHNNFLEVLASGGIVGFIIYYAKYVYLIVMLFRLKLHNHKHSPVVMALLLVLLVMDWGVVSYYSKQTYFYLMLYFVHLQNVKREIRVHADQKTA